MRCLRQIVYTVIRGSQQGSLVLWLRRVCDSYTQPAREERLALARMQWRQQTTRERSSTALPMTTDSSTLTHNMTSRATSAIELRDVTKRFLTPAGQAYTAIRDITFSVAPGEFCAVVGPTGCGKSTTLGLISGLERPSAGEVQVMGEPVQGIDPRIGYVFQSDAVFPWKNVLNNVATGPTFRHQRKAEALERARDWIT